jgi:hypothetical protein
VLIRMGTCGACCHKRGKGYVRDKEAKLRDRALGRAKELVHMNAPGAEELLQDVQTYHDLHQEIVVQKMHQITPPRGAFMDRSRSCGNPQCNKGNCRRPRHTAVGFSSATQSAQIIEADQNHAEDINDEDDADPEGTEYADEFADPLLLNNKFGDPSMTSGRRESERSSQASSRTPSPSPSPPRQVAARKPSPPTILDPQQTNNLGNLMKKWQQTQDERDAYADSRRHLATRGRTAMENEYSRGHEQKVLRERLLEQRDRQIFEGLQAAENQRKLRRPYAQVNTLDSQLRRYTAVPMGLPYTSLDWASLSEHEKKEAAAKHEKREEQEEQEEQLIDEDQYRGEEQLRKIEVSSPSGDRVDNYYFEGTKLFKVKSEESYDREDRDLAASLRRNAAAAAATVARQ